MWFWRVGTGNSAGAVSVSDRGRAAESGETNMDAPSRHELAVYARLGVEIEAGSGTRVRTSAGEELIDFYGGHAVAILGYGYPGLVSAVSSQASRLIFQSAFVDVQLRSRAAARLASFAPKGLERVFFVNSGAEANENALRIAMRMTGRRRVVALEGGFHGRTAAAAACTHGAGWYGFPERPFAVTFVAPDDLSALDGALADDVAALIIEPVQGKGGARDLDDDYVRQARRWTRDRGIYFIADEVQCGMGRTGRAFAVDWTDTQPDVLTTAKGLGGGFPVGAVIVGDEVGDTFGPGELGTTFGGGPMACAAVEAVLDALEEDGFLERVREVGRAIIDRCQVGPVTAVQGRGLLVGLRTTKPAREILGPLRAQGILAGPCADPHVIRLMPPLTVTTEDVEALRQALLEIGS